MNDQIRRLIYLSYPRLFLAKFIIIEQLGKGSLVRDKKGRKLENEHVWILDFEVFDSLNLRKLKSRKKSENKKTWWVSSKIENIQLVFSTSYRI